MVIQSIELDGLKKSDLVNSSTSAAIPSTCGYSAKPKPEMFSNALTTLVEITTKSQTRINFGLLQNLMVIKPAFVMAQLWEGNISDACGKLLFSFKDANANETRSERLRTIARALKKIGFTRKKRPMAIKSGMRSNGKHS